MAADAGRAMRVNYNSTAIAGVRTKTVTFNGEPIDITSDDDSGWRTLLADTAAVRSVDISVEGVTKDDILRAAWYSGSLLEAMEVEWGDGASLTGNFHLGSYAETGATEDAVTFTATFNSSGAPTYTGPST